MNYWNDRYNKQGWEHFGATWHINDETYKLMILQRKDFFSSWVDEGLKSVLDYGCGNAYMCDMFEDYLGWDIVPELIRANKKAYPDKKFELISKIKTIPEQMDLVLCISSMQYHDNEIFENRIKLFSQFAENLIIQDSTIKADDHTFYRTNRYVKRICKKYGYKIHKETKIGARWLWFKKGEKI